MRTLVFVLGALLSGSAAAQTVKLGELNSYKVFPAFLEPYRKGMELALEEINAAGGAAGRKLELVSRDDGGTPGDAVRVAEELIAREKVSLLMGTFASNVGLAVANLANQRKVLFLASEPLTDKLVWEDGNRYTFRLRPSTYMQTAMLIGQAAKLGKKRWAIVYPNYEYGQSATAAFKKQILFRQSGGLEFVEQALKDMAPVDARGRDGRTALHVAAGAGKGAAIQILLDAGASHPDANLTWVIDPALLSDVSTMTGRYLVGGQPSCTGAAYQPASTAAARWLAELRKVTPDQPTVLTPYANVDMTALVHQGLTRDLATAYRTGEAVASSVLHGTFGHDIAWPPRGSADLSVLTYLAAGQHVGTVVLNSSAMPPVNADAVFRPDDAVASVKVAGLPMNVLLSDNTLTGILRAGNTSSGTLPANTEFAVRQRFLAETAMIAAEAPDSKRTIVVAPPDDWSPSEALAGDLLGETATAPWVTPAQLTSLSSAPDTERAVPRQPLLSGKASPGELSPGYLSKVRGLGDRVAVYKSMLYKPAASYTRSLDEALLATESAAWRGRRAAQGAARADHLSEYIRNADNKVTFISSGQVPMGGASGLVPVSIQNGLHQAIRVRVVATVADSPLRTSQLTIGHFQDVVTIAANSPGTVRLPVNSAPQGSTQIKLSLISADGTRLPFTETSITVLSTRYGRAILFLIGAAIGVLVLTSLYRAVRRWMHGDTHLVNEEADPPGSVVTGTSDARHPTEAPDDLADARRWVDDA